VGWQTPEKSGRLLSWRPIHAGIISLSVMATQVSAISLIGAPAFIALKSNGGLVWLQYEFAVPLAMIPIMLILIPLYRKIRAITIYEYLEKRFGKMTRTTISGVFLVSRGLGSGVALLATGIVTAVCLDWPLVHTILLIGVVSIIYTTFGGIVADIYSDIIQLVILWVGSVVAIVVLGGMLDAQSLNTLFEDNSRLQVFNFSNSGLGDGQTFAFWPMLIGGLFLYLSYYGCDQSQAQRLLTTKTANDAQLALVMNGVLRFFLVLTYCALGVLLIPFLLNNPEFSAKLAGRQPDFLIPYFFIEYIPTGILGLLIAGFFAASMSSIDSALNSLSAATYQDFLVKMFPKLDKIDDKCQILLSRLLTIFWGIVATVFALHMIGGSETVLELVNKIGSAFYGPILATFWLGMLTKRGTQTGVITGLLCGVGFNIFLWQFYGSEVSWLWWNVFGFLISYLVGFIISLITRSASAVTPSEDLLLRWSDLSGSISNKKYIYILIAAFLGIIIISLMIERFFSAV
jgi:SSS family solute:Na+ symporter